MAPVQSRMYIPHFDFAQANSTDPAAAHDDVGKRAATTVGLCLAVILVSVVIFCNWLRLRHHPGLNFGRPVFRYPVRPTQSDEDLREAVREAHYAQDLRRALEQSAARDTDDESIVEPAPPYAIYAEGEMPPAYDGSTPPPPYKSQESIITRPAPAVLPNH